MTPSASRSAAANKTQQAVVIALVAIACAVVLLFATGCSCSANPQSSGQAQSGSASGSASSSATSASSAAASSQVPAEFAEIRSQNKDAYAWITMPDTQVNHPILQNPLIDNYYLVHDAYGNDNGLGALYTQTVNALDFHDPVTIVYGHTFENGGVVSDDMLGTLHYYEDEKFFNEHPNFTIYTTDKVLTYQVVSAYEYDDRHIMNSYDFSNPEIVQTYFDYVLNPDSMNKHVREHARLVPGTDHIVQLSTCTHPPVDTARYLITGVLVDEQPIK